MVRRRLGDIPLKVQWADEAAVANAAGGVHVWHMIDQEMVLTRCERNLVSLVA